MTAAPTIAPARMGATPVADDGAWPNTSRAMPWLIATFLVLLWLTPIAAIKLPVDLPVDARPDRLFLGLLAIAWLAGAFDASRDGTPRRASLVHWALGLFLACVTASLLIRWPDAVLLGESEVALKKALLLLAYSMFFLIAVSTLRRDEVPRFAMLIAALAALTGLGTLYEYLAGVNLFYRVSDTVLPGFDVEFAPSGVVSGRKVVVGPTEHGLAVTTILAMALPFALAFAVRAISPSRRLLWSVAAALIVIGAIATSRKTAIIAPVVAVAVFAAYRPKVAIRLLPVFLATAAALVLVAADPLQSTLDLLTGSGSSDTLSTQGRVADYEALRPDVLSNLLIGRGYGTYDPALYRILDNAVLGLLVSVGALGVIAFMLLVGAIARTAHVAARATDPLRADVAAGIVGATAAFLVVSVLFDSIVFVPVPYLLMFFGACAVVLARDVEDQQRTVS